MNNTRSVTYVNNTRMVKHLCEQYTHGLTLMWAIHAWLNTYVNNTRSVTYVNNTRMVKHLCEQYTQCYLCEQYSMVKHLCEQYTQG